MYLIDKPIGEVLNNSAFELNPANALLPDLAFMLLEHSAEVDPTTAFPGPPDLAVEVMSPSDKWSEVSDKVREYLQAGVPLVWVVDPFDEGVLVYRSGQPRRLFNLEDEPGGEDLLPGFKLEVKALFA